MRLKNVTLVQLRTFLSLIRNESFTKAGQDLAVSPATVTSQIKQLEDALETRLLFRTTRSVKLTDAGAVLARQATQILHLIEAIPERPGAVANLERGEVSVGIIGTAGYVMPKVLASYRQLREWADVLEQRVKERTQELEEANRQLDITSRQLILSEKLAAIGEITAGVAHEINNPLAVIQGNLDVIHSELGENARGFKTEFSLIQDRIQAIHILIGKLLRFARPEEFAESDQAIDVAQTVRDTIPLVHHLILKARIELVLMLEAAPLITINTTELQQVLVNLCSNAIQAMPDGGTLRIECRPSAASNGAKVEIIVADTGQGMAPDIAAKVFDPFFTTKGREGTGLGLSITRDIIHRAGGTIHLETDPGQGTSFIILLPAHGRSQ